MENSEKFKNWWSGIQSIVTIGIMIGGSIWTVHTFGALRQKAIADTQLAEAQHRLEDVKFKEGTLDFQIDAKANKVPNDPGYYIEIAVRIKNIGNQDVLICLEDPGDPGESNCNKDAGYPCDAKSVMLPLRSPVQNPGKLRPPSGCLFNSHVQH